MTRKRIRGSAVRQTLPYVIRYSSLWLAVTLTAVAVHCVSAYMVLASALTDEARQEFLVVLTGQSATFILALLALAVFHTHRLAGPFIALRKAVDDIRAGDLSRRLHFRRSDGHLRELEVAFNDMMATLEGKAPGVGKEADDTQPMGADS
jgi:nitrogen fixation/metabolism regulation signal transduction histidine kinase